MEICPNCGQDTKSLNDYTGWCRSCSASQVDKCIRCAADTNGKKICRRCNTLDWLERNANELDRLIATGLSKSAAIKRITEGRETSYCKICNAKLRKTSHGVPLFCRKKKMCISAHNKFRNMIYRKHIDRETALKEVISSHKVRNSI